MDKSKTMLIAACGNYCGCCTDYLAYIKNDEKLKEKLAEELGKQFSMDIKPEDVGCLGCHGPISKRWCASCHIKRCTQEKGILTCAFCSDFPCEILEEYYEKEENGDNYRRNILRQREIGLEKWLIETQRNDGNLA